MNKLNFDNKLLAASAYALFIPAFYIALTNKRKNKLMAFHASQALLLWGALLLAVIILRVLMGLIWHWVYFPFLDRLAGFIRLTFFVYALYCGNQVFKTEKFAIPYISALAEELS